MAASLKLLPGSTVRWRGRRYLIVDYESLDAIIARQPGKRRLERILVSVSDDGQGVPSEEVEERFFAEGQEVHALTLLRRRLQGLFGHSFQLKVRSEIGARCLARTLA